VLDTLPRLAVERSRAGSVAGDSHSALE